MRPRKQDPVLQPSLFEAHSAYNGQLPRKSIFTDTPVSLTVLRESSYELPDNESVRVIGAFTINPRYRPTFYSYPWTLQSEPYRTEGDAHFRSNLDIFTLKPAKSVLGVPAPQSEEYEHFTQDVLRKVFTEQSISAIKTGLETYTPPPKGGPNVTIEATILGQAAEDTFKNYFEKDKKGVSAAVYEPEAVVGWIDEERKKLPDRAAIQRLKLLPSVWGASIYRHFYSRAENEMVWNGLSKLYKEVIARKTAIKVVASYMHEKPEETENGLRADYEFIVKTASRYAKRR